MGCLEIVRSWRRSKFDNHIGGQKIFLIEKSNMGSSLAVQWLGLGASTAMVQDLIPGQKFPQASQKKKKKVVKQNFNLD